VFVPAAQNLRCLEAIVKITGMAPLTRIRRMGIFDGMAPLAEGVDLKLGDVGDIELIDGLHKEFNALALLQP